MVYSKQDRAHQMVSSARCHHIIKSQDRCSKCGNGGYIVAHHRDYDKPLEVVWLCQSCHMKEHRTLKQFTKNLNTPKWLAHISLMKEVQGMCLSGNRFWSRYAKLKLERQLNG